MDEELERLIKQKVYLGDGVYVVFDLAREMVKLTTEDGIREIFLEPEVLRAFEAYVRDLRSRIEHAGGRL